MWAAAAAAMALLMTDPPRIEWPARVHLMAAPDAAQWRDAPEYLPLFAPRALRGRYRVDVSPLPLEQLVAALAADESLLRAPGAWEPRSEGPLDAFGSGGSYNPWLLRRVYGAVQPRVARGPRVGENGIIESWILVSPYPDPAMSRLHPGTLRIIVAL